MEQQSAKEQLLARARTEYRPQLVGIDNAAISRLPVRENRFALMASGLAGRPCGRSGEAAAAYIVALNAMNFMFWSPTPDGAAPYSWNGDTGSSGMRAAFDSVWGEDPTPGQLRARFGAGEEQAIVDVFGDISMPRRRAQLLREVLAEDRLEQAAAELVAAGRTGRLSTDDALNLARRFPLAYGQDPYLKRAQLAVIWYAGYLAEQGVQVDLDVAPSADYQMPRVMRAIGVLRYAPELAAKVDACALIMRDSEEERAIRAATVLAAEAMAAHLGATEPEIDSALWKNRAACGATPYHLTVTTDY